MNIIRESSVYIRLISHLQGESITNAKHFAAYIILHLRRNLLDITASRSPVDQRAQSQQIIGTEPGSPIRCLGKQILFGNIGPGRQHRMQPPLGVVIHHPILSPVLPPRRQDEAHSALRMKGMGDLERRDYGCTTARITDSC